jgi:membrane protease YdiL (CAAX protease family)
MIWRLLVAAIIEVAYAIFTRTWLSDHYSGVTLELLTTGCRASALVAFFVLFRHLLRTRPNTPRTALHPPLLAAIALCLAVPLAVATSAAPLPVQLVFAATSLIVAAKEEVLYRGALQNLLEQRVGPWVAIAISNVIFVAYHYGTLPFTPLNTAEWFLAGVVLGALYLASGSLLVAISVHAAYDALWSLGPYLSGPWPRPWATVLLILAVACCLVWSRLRSNKALQSDALASRVRA